MVVAIRTYLCVAAVLMASADASAQQNQARAWADPSTSDVGRPFWIYVEASGNDVTLPTAIEVDGLRFDSSQKSEGEFFSFTPSGRRNTVKRGFYTIASQAGIVRVPPIKVTIGKKTVFTKPFEIAIQDRPIDTQNNRGEASTPGEQRVITEDDLVFIDMDVDKREVYQGEQILLTQRLWQIDHPKVRSGPKSGALIVPPTTEGFYAITLEETPYKETKNRSRYVVSAERKILYPTRTGTLSIGPWHWEGIALVRNERTIFQDRFGYSLDADPISITVKPLPERPPGFSGSVGTFRARATLSRNDLLQGVPEKLTVTVTGKGNPNAIGPPHFEVPKWAYVTEPETKVAVTPSPGSPIPGVTKSFVYSITPLQAGDLSIPPINFIWFDPEAEQYQTASMGPFQVTVQPSGEPSRPPILSPGLAAGDRRIRILAEDIRPVLARTGSITVTRGSGSSTAALSAAPVLIYILFALYMMRRRRFENDTGFARAHRARPNALKALDAVVHSPEPADELYRVVLSFVGHTLNINETGMTSNDIQQQLIEADFGPSLVENAVKILRACERARYASQGLTENEIHALVHGARAFVIELDQLSRKGVGQ